jgi:hypothetical protein
MGLPPQGQVIYWRDGYKMDEMWMNLPEGGGTMESFHEAMMAYKKEMQQGTILRAYRGLMAYLMALRTQFAARYPDYVISGSLYMGFMDMSYFSFTPKALAERKLKIAVVFLHETCRFEVWLAAANKQVQTRIWQQIKASGWTKYPLVASTQGADAVIEHILVAEPDFSDLPALSGQIERGTLRFIQDVEEYLNLTKIC